MNGADVISISMSGGCGDLHFLCAIPPDDIYDMMLQSVRFARSFLVPVVAAAGNDGDDIAEKDVYPCQTEGVICVGSVDRNKMNVYNFGASVNIWAPTRMYSTVTPLTASADADDIDTDELYLFGGTSSSPPFVAGAIGLMKSANPNLSYERVLETLLATANPSPDARVPRGYVDVYRAVRELLPNQPPTVQITRPSDGQTLGWRAAPLLQVNYSDPEVNPENIYRWHGEVVYASEQDGELCRSSFAPVYLFLEIGRADCGHAHRDGHGDRCLRGDGDASDHD